MHAHVPSMAFVVDDNQCVRECVSNLLGSVGIEASSFRKAREFLEAKRPDAPSCLILDVRLPDMSGLDLQTELGKRGQTIPIVFISGHADVPMSVQAMKAGACDFLCKPFREEALLAAVRDALSRDFAQRATAAELSLVHGRYKSLTNREREIMRYVASGAMNKQIAVSLGLSEITVKVHRASVLRKMMARSLAELVRQADTIAAMVERGGHEALS